MTFDSPAMSSPQATKWILWLDQQPPKGVPLCDFKDSLKSLGCFSNNLQLSKFWNGFMEKRLRSHIPQHSNFRLFKEGVSPLWEDAKNIDGGKWLISIPKTKTMRIWAEVVAILFANCLNNMSNINGAVLSFRPRTDMITIWNSDSNDTQQVEEVMSLLRDTLDVEKVDYLVHRWSVERNSKRSSKSVVEDEAVVVEASAVERRPLALSKRGDDNQGQVAATTVATEEVQQPAPITESVPTPIVVSAPIISVDPLPISREDVEKNKGQFMVTRQLGIAFTLTASAFFYGILYYTMPLLE